MRSAALGTLAGEGLDSKGPCCHSQGSESLQKCASKASACVSDSVSHQFSFRMPGWWCPWMGAGDLNDSLGGPSAVTNSKGESWGLGEGPGSDPIRERRLPEGSSLHMWWHPSPKLPGPGKRVQGHVGLSHCSRHLRTVVRASAFWGRQTPGFGMKSPEFYTWVQMCF